MMFAQVAGLLKADDLMAALDQDDWADANMPEVVQHLNTNKHCHMPPQADWEA